MFPGSSPAWMWPEEDSGKLEEGHVQAQVGWNEGPVDLTCEARPPGLGGLETTYRT